MAKSLEGLTHAQKDEIIRKAIEVVERGESAKRMMIAATTMPILFHKLGELKDCVEKVMELKVEDKG